MTTGIPNYRSAMHFKQEHTSQRRWSLGAFFAATLAWIFYHRDLYFHRAQLLPRDNFYFHEPMFGYVATYLRQFGSFPDWFYAGNPGTSLAPLANNYLLLMPHRLLGVMLAASTPLPLNSVYKFSVLILGTSLFLVGIYLFARRYFGSAMLALLTVWVALTSSVSLIFFFAEQALATVFYVPFFWYLLAQCRQRASTVIGLGAVMGLSLNGHYPQLLILYYALALLISWAFGGRPFFSPKLLAWAAFAFLISASPVLYSYAKYHDGLISPYRRQTQSIDAPDYAEYLKVNRAQFTSVEPTNFLFYRGFRGQLEPVRMETLDVNAFYLSPLLPFLFLVSFLFLRHRVAQFIFIAALAVLACGIYGPAPRALWSLLPGIRFFRQWYYFLPLLNLHLLFLMVGVVAALWARLPSPTLRRLSLLVLALSTLPSALSQMDEVRTQLKKNSTPDRSASDPAFAHDLFQGGGQASLAFPGALDLPRTESLLREGRAHWVLDSGVTRLATDRDLTVAIVGDRFDFDVSKRPPDSHSLLLTQFDDGNWSGGTEAGSVRGLVQYAARETIAVGRSPSVWIFLVGLMWLPLALVSLAPVLTKLRLIQIRIYLVLEKLLAGLGVFRRTIRALREPFDLR